MPTSSSRRSPRYRRGVRVLSADEEGRLAYQGAVAAAASLPETVAVCDVGGGSTELVVGTPTGGPTWWRSIDLGCVRLTERFLVEGSTRQNRHGESGGLKSSATSRV